MTYYGVNYCPRKHCMSWSGWAFWFMPEGHETYFPDIKTTFFLRLLGIEFKRILWQKTLPFGPFRAALINAGLIPGAVHSVGENYVVYKDSVA